MKLTDDDKLLAIKISQVLQEYFDNNPPQKVLRSTDAYEILVKHQLVEKDRHSGVKFREFLSKLKNNLALNLIPQCRIEIVSKYSTNWFFESAPNKTLKHKNLKPLSQINRKQTINKEDLKAKIADLPKRDTADFDFIELGTREKYSRAYEYWTTDEEELLKSAIEEITDSFILSEIFGRQPSAIKRRLKDKFNLDI